MNKLPEIKDFFVPNQTNLVVNGEEVKLINFNFETERECRKILQRVSCIYVWYFSRTNKIYIGSAINTWSRVLNYRQSFCCNNKKNNIRLVRYVKKYGLGDIKLGILEIVQSDKKTLKDREQFYLDLLLPFEENGFNISKSAYRPLNSILSKEGRKKISERHRGENSERSKLTDVKILEIKEKLFQGMTATEISKEYGVSITVISNIQRGKVWTHVKSNPKIESFLKNKTDQQRQKFKHLIPEIAEKLKNGETMISLSQEYSMKYTTINNIKIRYVNEKR
jgi:group I intron endonuclease